MPDLKEKAKKKLEEARRRLAAAMQPIKPSGTQTQNKNAKRQLKILRDQGY